MQAPLPDALPPDPPASESLQRPRTLLIAPLPTYNTGLLASVIVLGVIYAAWIYVRNAITGSNFWDATIGVLLGIYICSRPVSNLLDMIYAQNIRWKDLKKRAGMTWLVMNFVTTFVGWATIVLGATRMVRPD
jgi:hypothetical protein